jgi:hypothetical protein
MRTLCGNKDGKFFEYLHHFSDNDGNRVEPISQGLSAEMPEEVRNLVTFKDLGLPLAQATLTWGNAATSSADRQGSRNP